MGVLEELLGEALVLDVKIYVVAEVLVQFGRGFGDSSGCVAEWMEGYQSYCSWSLYDMGFY